MSVDTLTPLPAHSLRGGGGGSGCGSGGAAAALVAHRHPEVRHPVLGVRRAGGAARPAVRAAVLPAARLHQQYPLLRDHPHLRARLRGESREGGSGREGARKKAST